MSRRIDLNCDLGEGIGDDAAVLPYLSSANIACGAHAGDAMTMYRTVAAAVAAHVVVGAHPGFPDRENFGRRALPLTPDEIFATVLTQVASLAAIARVFGARLGHVKPHGALYHVASDDGAAADAIVRAVVALRADLTVVGAPDSALAASAARHGLAFAGEIFADRNYGEDGRLLPRSHPEAQVALAPAAAALRVVAMVEKGVIVTAAGTAITQSGRTLCLHGDDPQVVTRAQALRAAFAAAGITVAPLSASP